MITLAKYRTLCIRKTQEIQYLRKLKDSEKIERYLSEVWKNSSDRFHFLLKCMNLSENILTNQRIINLAESSATSFIISKFQNLSKAKGFVRNNFNRLNTYSLIRNQTFQGELYEMIAKKFLGDDISLLLDPEKLPTINELTADHEHNDWNLNSLQNGLEEKRNILEKLGFETKDSGWLGYINLDSLDIRCFLIPEYTCLSSSYRQNKFTILARISYRSRSTTSLLPDTVFEPLYLVYNQKLVKFYS